MNILFVGGIYPLDEEKKIFKKSKIFPYAAANNHQYNIINGLKENIKVDSLDVISSEFLGTFPREYTDLWIPKREWKIDNVNVFDTEYLNIFAIRTIWREKTVYNEIIKWCENHIGKKYIIVYSMLTPLMKASKAVKKKYNDIKLCIYIPDLPIFFVQNRNKGIIYRFLKRFDCKSMLDSLNYFDAFILLTKEMNTEVNRLKKPYLVAEGIINKLSDSITNDIFDFQKKSFVYTGKIDIDFGILELIKAFMLINGNEYSLEIYGNGDAERLMPGYSELDSRIHYYGTLPRNEILKIQQSAFILVNPRNSVQDFTKYSFPSKTMEYLAAGRPVIMHRLSGIPNEYDKYLNYFTSDNPQIMANQLKELADTPISVLNNIGKIGQEFILKNKNQFKQGDILVEFLSNL